MGLAHNLEGTVVVVDELAQEVLVGKLGGVRLVWLARRSSWLLFVPTCCPMVLTNHENRSARGPIRRVTATIPLTLSNSLISHQTIYMREVISPK